MGDATRGLERERPVVSRRNVIKGLVAGVGAALGMRLMGAGVARAQEEPGEIAAGGPDFAETVVLDWDRPGQPGEARTYGLPDGGKLSTPRMLKSDQDEVLKELPLGEMVRLIARAQGLNGKTVEIQTGRYNPDQPWTKDGEPARIVVEGDETTVVARNRKNRPNAPGDPELARATFSVEGKVGAVYFFKVN